MPSEGDIQFKRNAQDLAIEEVYKHVAYAAPYLEFIDELKLEEVIAHHAHFKPFRANRSAEDVLELLNLASNRSKRIKGFSSGMKMRLRLGLAILSDTPLLLLDEPLSNLDEAGRQWYKDLILKEKEGRTIIVGSNNLEEEFFFCDNSISLV